ncbi:MAG: SDR family NAD(P)-dependent oxidoreductase [Stellaceae bacterium]
MTTFVTGAAGFIGSNLVDRLLGDGEVVIGYDNLSTGVLEFIASARRNRNFTFIQGDLLDSRSLTEAMRRADRVVHLAANADVRFGLAQPRRDLEQNTIATFNVLEAMRSNTVREIAFSSTGSIYGEAAVVPTPEDAPFPVQTSLYGASKLACEGMITAYAEGYGMKARIFRFVSILGQRYSHGHVFDFMKQLSRDANKLHILGDGKQRKSYLHVDDCIEAMLLALNSADKHIAIFNLGADEACQVLDCVNWIVGRLKLSPQLSFSGGRRGWIGDNPLIYLDTSRIRGLGWRPKRNISEAVELTVDWLDANRWIFAKRH